MSYTVGVVGTGADPDDPDYSGFAMAYNHARAYEGIDSCELVACADIVPENAAAFAAEFDIDDGNVYESHETLLAEVQPDIVSVTVPPAAHAEIVVDCARAGVAAIHCEKPMALTWGGARLMAQEAERHGTKLTFNHQRRFGAPWRRAKELLDGGEIGELRRVETAAPNLYDWGTHAIDLCNYYNDEHPAEWVLGQIDYREQNIWFGAHNENQGLALWEYANGVHGFAAMGGESDPVGALNRLVGTDGAIEVRVHDGPDLRIRRGDGWEAIDCEDDDMGLVANAIQDVVRALEEGAESELSARNALNATEIIFGTYESSRKRGRVDFPLEIEDNPLAAMVESGALTPAEADDE